jgi:hypothetical protein
MSRRISELDEAELGRLQDAVTKAENALYFAGNAPSDQIGKLRREIQVSKQQMGQIEVEWKQKDREAEAKEHEQQMVLSTLVAKETALNPQERQQYGDFLKEKFFTKSDFNNLAHFYSHSWDKLTEGGKDQMSHRVWEGVRHGEYKFDELPDVVKEKEGESLYDVLRKDKKDSPELHAIPIEDRKAFLDAWANKDCRKAYEILDRPSFKENVAKSVPQSVVSESATVVKTETAERLVQTEKREESGSKKPTSGNAIGETDFKLDDLKLRDADATNITPPLPSGGGARTR